MRSSSGFCPKAFWILSISTRFQWPWTRLVRSSFPQKRSRGISRCWSSRACARELVDALLAVGRVERVQFVGLSGYQIGRVCLCLGVNPGLPAARLFALYPAICDLPVVCGAELRGLLILGGELLADGPGKDVLGGDGGGHAVLLLDRVCDCRRELVCGRKLLEDVGGRIFMVDAAHRGLEILLEIWHDAGCGQNMYALFLQVAKATAWCTTSGYLLRRPIRQRHACDHDVCFGQQGKMRPSTQVASS